MAGETGPILDTVSLPIAMVIAGFFALACYNSIEIFIFIFHTFKRKSGLYFWSMMAANAGIPIHAISVLLRFFDLAPNLPMCVVICIGWFLMVTGQALVLYSRLHLVVENPNKIRWVLIMITVVFFAVQVPTAALFIATNASTQLSDLLLSAFDIFEKTQISVFTVQESIISGLYVYESTNGLKLMELIKGPRLRTVNRELIMLCILVVSLDITLMVTEYTNNFQIQTTYKPVVYSIKLKVEALVLNNLRALVQTPNCDCWNSLENYNTPSADPNPENSVRSLSNATTQVPPIWQIHSCSHFSADRAVGNKAGKEVLTI